MLSKKAPRQTDDINSSSWLYTHYRYHGLETHIFSGSASSQPLAASCNVGATTHLSLVDQLCVRRTYGANQQLISTTDAHGQKTRFWANALGNISLIEDADPEHNLTAANYNPLGQRTELFDPNMGNWQFNYNGLGELRSQIDANNQTTAFTYDLLGRLTQRTTAGNNLDTLIDRWHYDDDGVPEGLPGQPGEVDALNPYIGLLGSTTREQAEQLVYARIYRYEPNKG
jgi:YD repeat-containing protein